MEQWIGETATQSPLQPVQQADNDSSTMQLNMYTTVHGGIKFKNRDTILMY